MKQILAKLLRHHSTSMVCGASRVLFAKMEMLLFLEFHFTHMVYFHLSANR